MQPASCHWCLMTMEPEVQSSNAQTPPVNPPPVADSSSSANPAATADRTFEVLCHILGLAGLTGIPFANVLGPLILWLLKRAEFPAVDEHGKESLNFQISMTIWVLLCVPLMFIFIGFIAAAVLVVLNVVWVIIAALKASKGEFYRYPMTIRFFK